MTGIDPQNWERAIACARTRWLQDLLNEYLPEIARLDDTPHDRERAQQWDAKMKELMEARGLTTPSQQKNRLVDIRNALKILDPNHPALADVGFTPAEWEEINRASEDKISDRSTKFLTLPDAIVNRAIELLNSREWNEIAAGLAVLTGRRCAEILKTASFKEKTAYSVTFTGALKRQDEPVALEFEIPTLAPAHEVVEAIAKLRSWVDTSGLDNRQVNNLYADGVIKACDRHFNELVPTRDGEDNLYTHLFRAVYATIATHWYCPPNVPPLEYRAYIQGHFKILDEKDPTLRRSLAAQRNYFDYQIGDGKGNVDGRLGIKLGEPDVKVLEAFQRYYQPISQATTASEMSDRSSLLSQIREVVPSMLRSDRAWVILTGLMVVTGRGCGELLKSRIFEVDPSHSFSLLFSSTVAKDKETILTLIEGSVVLDAIAELKKHPDVQPLLYLSPNQIDNRCTPHVEAIVGDYFPFNLVTQLQEAYLSLTNESAVSPTPQKSKKPHTVIYNIHSDDKQRLNAIARQFNTPTQAATATVALDWAEAALQLAHQLELDSLEALHDWVAQPSQSLPDQPVKQVDVEIPPVSSSADAIANQSPNQSLELRVLEGFDRQQQDIALLTQSIHSLVSALGGQKLTPTTLTDRHSTSQPTIPQQEPHQPSVPRSARQLSPGRSSQAAEAKINAAIDAIMQYNNEVATTKKDKWAISISALKELTKCFQGAISRVIADRRDDIEHHHALHELGQFHNSKGKFAPKISDVITLD